LKYKLPVWAGVLSNITGIVADITMPVSKNRGNMEKWFIREFDRSWVMCKSCKRLFLYNQMKRKNKCPKCKLNNYDCGVTVVTGT